VPGDFLAIIDTAARFPHFVGSRSPEVVKDFSNVLWSAALPSTLRADFLGVQHRNKVVVRILALTAVESAKSQ
jgi:hypothetical protein